MSDVLISVVTPYFNPGRYLAEAVRSVLDQDYRPLELLLVDDASNDGSLASIVGLGDPQAVIRPLRLPVRGGPAAARNVALRAARGDLFAFLDADDLMLPGRLSFQADLLAEREDVDVVTGGAEYQVEPGVTPPPWMRESPRSVRARYRNMTMMARRTVFDRVGLFDPSFQVGGDTEWLLRAEAAGVNVLHRYRKVIRRRIHGDSLTYRAAEGRKAQKRSVPWRPGAASRRSTR